MKDIVERLGKKGIVFEKLTPIDIKREFKSRKKLNLYLGVDLEGYYICLIDINRQSRILQKQSLEFMEFHQKLELHINSNIKRKYIYIQAPICSKAQKLLEDEGWRVLI